MFGKTPHSSAEAAVAHALNDSTDHNCAHLVFETCCIQFRDGKDPVHNVTGFSGARTPSDVERNADLVSLDSDGTQYVVLGSEATTVDGVLAEVEDIAAAFDEDLTTIEETKSFRAGTGNLREDLKALLPFV